MRTRRTDTSRAVVTGTLILALAAGVGSRSLRGDEPGRLGRLFRKGGGSPSAPPEPSAPVAVPSGDQIEPLPAGGEPAVVTPSVVPNGGTPPLPAEAHGPVVNPRILPRPRVSQAATDADPLLTRVTLGRSDDGNQFGMFLQVYADGTVIDSEGVHSLGREAVRGVVEAIQSGDLFRLRGHCGSPSTDFVESVQVVIFERSFGRLRAASFSFSGNPQGCDKAVRHLQSQLDALQARITRTPTQGGPVPVENAPAVGPLVSPGAPVPPSLPTGPTGPTIRLNEALPSR